jgi:hypothetical protein
MIGGQRLAALLQRRRERSYFEVSWPWLTTTVIHPEQ